MGPSFLRILQHPGRYLKIRSNKWGPFLKALELAIAIAVRVMDTKLATVTGAAAGFFQDDGALENVNESPAIHVAFDYRIDYYLSLDDDQTLIIL